MPRGTTASRSPPSLCVALIAATAWAVLAAGWVHGGGGAIVVAVTSVIEAALLAQARAPRIATAIAAPFLGLAAIVPTTLAAMPAAPGPDRSAPSPGTTCSALFTGLASTQDWDFTVGLCAILFLCGYWLGWMVLREHRGVLAVIPVFSVLATNVVNAARPQPDRAARDDRGGARDRAWSPPRTSGRSAIAGRRRASPRWTASAGASAAAPPAVAVVLTIVALVLPADIDHRHLGASLSPRAQLRGRRPREWRHRRPEVPTPSASARR